MMKLCIKQAYIFHFAVVRKIKALIRLCQCTGWPRSLFFSCNKVRVSRIGPIYEDVVMSVNVEFFFCLEQLCMLL